MIKTNNDALFQTYSPFVVATADQLGALDLEPWGLATRWIIDPRHQRHATFFELLQRLDALTFGPEGMPMDKWVFYNCAELPGFIYGFALEHDRLSAHERALMRVPDDYVGPVPFSMYIAIPMREPGAWFGHNLASLNRTFPERQLHQLGTITKSIAMKAYRCESFCGATQWESTALFIHTKFGPLDLHTTYTPAHSIPETLTYAFTVTDDVLRAAAGDPDVKLPRPPADLWLDAADVAGMQRLQAELEAGQRFQLVGPPSVQAGHRVHPIRRITP
ncbi:MAG: hypothetical protein U1F43_20310 [Myxococcota bacterium]